MNILVRVRRRWWWAVIAIAVLLLGLVAAIGHPAQAVALSPGCEEVNQPSHDGTYPGVIFISWQMFAGERLIMSAGEPHTGTPSTLYLYFDGPLVDTAPFPGTVSYTVPADGIYSFGWIPDYGTVTWDVSCLPPGEHSGAAGPPYTGIKLLSDAQQAPYLSVPNAAGTTACGAFDVNGWGAKYVGLADFPGCTAPVTVMCFTGDGAWTADTVSGVVMHGDWEVDFTSSQDGTCGLFEQ